jgi:hypothetical protein
MLNGKDCPQTELSITPKKYTHGNEIDCNFTRSVARSGRLTHSLLCKQEGAWAPQAVRTLCGSFLLLL